MQQHYAPAYAYLWEDGGKWYVEKTYSMDQLKGEFKDCAAAFYRVKSGDDAVGYCKTIDGKIPANSRSGSYFYLQRLYLATDRQGLGIGGRVMQLLEQRAIEKQVDCFWLESMEVGDSRRFYERLGFEQTDRIRLPFPGMIEEYRGLLVMEKTLK